MERSTERTLTTHAGSLARPDDLRELLAAEDEGRACDAATLTGRVRDAVAEVVSRKVAVGIDVVNDGEQSKRDFTTCAREGLGGIEERRTEPGGRVLSTWGGCAWMSCRRSSTRLRRNGWPRGSCSPRDRCGTPTASTTSWTSGRACCSD